MPRLTSNVPFAKYFSANELIYICDPVGEETAEAAERAAAHKSLHFFVLSPGNVVVLFVVLSLVRIVFQHAESNVIMGLSLFSLVVAAISFILVETTSNPVWHDMALVVCAASSLWLGPGSYSDDFKINLAISHCVLTFFFTFTSLRRVGVALIMLFAEVIRLLNLAAAQSNWFYLLYLCMGDFIFFLIGILVHRAIYFLATELLRSHNRPRLTLQDMPGLLLLEKRVFGNLMRTAGLTNFPVITPTEHSQIIMKTPQIAECREQFLSTLTASTRLFPPNTTAVRPVPSTTDSKQQIRPRETLSPHRRPYKDRPEIAVASLQHKLKTSGRAAFRTSEEEYKSTKHFPPLLLSSGLSQETPLGPKTIGVHRKRRDTAPNVPAENKKLSTFKQRHEKYEGRSRERRSSSGKGSGSMGVHFAGEITSVDPETSESSTEILSKDNMAGVSPTKTTAVEAKFVRKERRLKSVKIARDPTAFLFQAHGFSKGGGRRAPVMVDPKGAETETAALEVRRELSSSVRKKKRSRSWCCPKLNKSTSSSDEEEQQGSRVPRSGRGSEGLAVSSWEEYVAWQARRVLRRRHDLMSGRPQGLSEALNKLDSTSQDRASKRRIDSSRKEKGDYARGWCHRFWMLIADPATDALMQTAGWKSKPEGVSAKRLGSFRDEKIERWYLAWRGSTFARYHCETQKILITIQYINGFLPVLYFAYKSKPQWKNPLILPGGILLLATTLAHVCATSLFFCKQRRLFNRDWAEWREVSVKQIPMIRKYAFFVYFLCIFYQISFGFTQKSKDLVLETAPWCSNSVAFAFLTQLTQRTNLLLNVLIICVIMIVKGVTFRALPFPQHFLPILSFLTFQQFLIVKPIETNYRMIFQAYVLPYLLYIDSLKPIGTGSGAIDSDDEISLLRDGSSAVLESSSHTQIEVAESTKLELDDSRLPSIITDKEQPQPLSREPAMLPVAQELLSLSPA